MALRSEELGRPGAVDRSDGPEPNGAPVNGTRAAAHRLDTFLDDYGSYVRDVLQPYQARIRALLEGWQQPDAWTKYKRANRVPIPTPVRRISSRIKRPEQVVDKIFRKPGSFPAGLSPASFHNMHDALGVRLTVYFLSHLPLIDRELRSGGELELCPDEPPVAYMSADQTTVLSLGHLERVEKESGYSSIHYTVRLLDPELPPQQRPWFELQVCTLTQELWSTMEHHLGYKPGKGSNVAIKKQFRILSKQLAAIDEHFTFLYEELNRFQEEVAYEADDPLNAENLPPVLAELGISCAQRDINNIIKFLYSRGVESVLELRSLGRPRRLDMVRNTFLAEIGRLPFNLEVIASLAALRGAPTERDELERIRSQIAYRGAWDSIRQEFTKDEGGG